jgi:hypothetical protein
LQKSKNKNYKNLGTKITKIQELKLQYPGTKILKKSGNKSYKNPGTKSYKNLGNKIIKIQEFFFQKSEN